MPVTLLTGELGSIVGEYKESGRAQAAPIAMPTDGSFRDLFTLSLAPGDWDLVGTVLFSHPTATAVDHREAGISTISLAIPRDGHEAQNCGPPNGNRVVSLFVAKRISLGVTTTIYMVARTAFTGGGCNCWGYIGATRAK
jgi:hypothetical protein